MDNGTRYKCKKCGDEIYWDTRKKLVYCKCGALGIDGSDYYVRVLGNPEDHELIHG